MTAELPGPLETLFAAIADAEAGALVDTAALRADLDGWERKLTDTLADDTLSAEHRQATATVARFVRDSAPAIDLLAEGDALGAEVAVCRAMGFPSLQIPDDAAGVEGNDYG